VRTFSDKPLYASARGGTLGTRSLLISIGCSVEYAEDKGHSFEHAFDQGKTGIVSVPHGQVKQVSVNLLEFSLCMTKNKE
jgi:hypothetical protein